VSRMERGWWKPLVGMVVSGILIFDGVLAVLS
jgi:hypothetical protein